MQLPVNPPIYPMLATRVSALPLGDDWYYEPKWDGFRTLIFRDGEEVLLQSRDEKSLNRYFPELILPLKAALQDSGLDFDALQLRIHPAASRIEKLSRQIPAFIIFFDLLCRGERDLRDAPFRLRRQSLEELLADAAPPIHLSPATTDSKTASDWFGRFEGAGLDGVMAKHAESVYEPGKRVMLKIKHERECDCVVAGFRWHKRGGEARIGSLLLGLHDENGKLQHVGVCASFTDKKRQELVDYLAPYRKNALRDHPWKGWADSAGQTDFEAHRMPGGLSRWSQGKDLSWEPLRPELVVEVAYDHLQGDRFRHTAQFRRWRPDKSPRECTYAQLEVVPPYELQAIFGGGR
jgi:ATP-dependent DNA ligase